MVLHSFTSPLCWGDGYHEKIPKQCCCRILLGERGSCIPNVYVGFSHVSAFRCYFYTPTLLFRLIPKRRNFDCISLFGYIEDRLSNNLPVDGERLNGFVCLLQSILLASFATILASHRSEILDQKISDDDDVAYEAPRTTANHGSFGG